MDSLEKLVEFAEQKGVESVPVDVEMLAALLNIDVYFEDLDNETSGYIERRGDRWCIGVNRHHSKKRQRFTIAHELGHYVLHRRRANSFTDHTFLRHSEESNPIEWEANRFAANLLMSGGSFRRAIENGMKNVGDLANHFNVSEMAVRVRAKELGYKGHGL